MLKVGITGVMGAGKSTVSGVLGKLGVSLYNCDKRAKELMVGECIAPLVELLGGEVLLGDGSLNRGYISSRIFSDAEIKKAVEAIVHSALRKDMLEWVEERAAEDYVVVESAILYGSIIEKDMDVVVAVVASSEVLYDRIAQRDGLTKEQIEARMSSQLSQCDIESRADEVIYSSNSELLVPKVVKLHKKLLTLSALKK
ncbi:MAG: dephospho-CoA kinase [Rikenellaceae bacterium]